MNDVLVKIGRFLFYNPWLTLGVIAELLDLSRSEQNLLKDEGLFERVRVPALSKRGYQVVFGLTVEGERRLVGRFRPAGSLAEALLMQFGRLEKARRVLVEFHRANRLHWSISPWRVSRGAPYLDALVSLYDGGGQAFLVGLLVPMQDAAVDWYMDMLKSWARWRKAASGVPAVLLLCTPPLGEDARRALGKLCPRDTENPVLWVSAEDVAQRAKWALLRPGDALYPVTWEPPPGLPASALRQEDYLKDARRVPAKGGGATLRAWVKRDKSDIAGSLAFFYRANPAEMELLETLSRFPCLSLEAYEKLYPHAKAVRRLHARMQVLLSNELAIRVEGPARLYLPGEKGLALLAGLSGVKTEAANRYLGFPVRPGHFHTQVEHHRITADFMLRLFSEGSLSAWDFIASRFVFSNLRAPSRPEIRRLVILPDSSGMFSLGSGKRGLFWLEVDRGTRKGKRLDAKLEKYFLTYYARLTWAPIPPLLYLIDTFNERDEARLQEVVRRLTKLGKKYPGTPITVLLTSGDLVRRSMGLLADARIWRRFHSETYHPDVLSLRALFEGRSI